MNWVAAASWFAAFWILLGLTVSCYLQAKPHRRSPWGFESYVEAVAMSTLVVWLLLRQVV